MSSKVSYVLVKKGGKYEVKYIKSKCYKCGQVKRKAITKSMYDSKYFQGFIKGGCDILCGDCCSDEMGFCFVKRGMYVYL